MENRYQIRGSRGFSRLAIFGPNEGTSKSRLVDALSDSRPGIFPSHSFIKGKLGWFMMLLSDGCKLNTTGYM